MDDTNWFVFLLVCILVVLFGCIAVIGGTIFVGFAFGGILWAATYFFAWMAIYIKTSNDTIRYGAPPTPINAVSDQSHLIAAKVGTIGGMVAGGIFLVIGVGGLVVIVCMMVLARIEEIKKSKA